MCQVRRCEIFDLFLRIVDGDAPYNYNYNFVVTNPSKDIDADDDSLKSKILETQTP